MRSVFHRTTFGLFVIAAVSSQHARGQTKLLAPEAKPGTYYAAFPHSIQLDGKIEDWNGMPHVTVRDGPKPGLNPNDNDSITFAVSADENNLYLLGIAPDKKIIAGQKKEFWQEDPLEFYLKFTPVSCSDNAHNF